ncbi:hypothetical protein PLESTM_001878000 [Pleodorina starrii]|nr:hypothetical protein PLESTM_001878000 [Pleodorina starrii]
MKTLEQRTVALGLPAQAGMQMAVQRPDMFADFYVTTLARLQQFHQLQPQLYPAPQPMNGMVMPHPPPAPPPPPAAPPLPNQTAADGAGPTAVRGGQRRGVPWARVAHTGDSDDEYVPSDGELEAAEQDFDSDYDEREPESKRKVFRDLYGKLTEYMPLAFFHFMCDALEIADTALKLMQVKEFKFGDIAGTVEACRQRLHTSFIEVAPGQYRTPALRAFFEQMQASGFTSYGGHNVTGVPPPDARLRDVHALVSEYARNLSDHLSRRFPDSAFLSALSLFDPAEYPEKLDDVEEWAAPKWKAIADYFDERRRAAVHSHACHPSLDVGAAEHEFFTCLGMKYMWEKRGKALERRKAFIEYHVKQKAMVDELLAGGVSLLDEGDGLDTLQSLNEPGSARPVHHVDAAYRELLSERRGLLPMFLKVMLFCIMIKPTSVNCERVFSYRTLLKTDRRARLSCVRLSQCLWLKYNTSGDLEVEGKMLKAAAKEYKSKVHMRLFNSIAEKIENQIRLPQFSRLRSV